MILKGKLWQNTLCCSNFTYYTGSRTEFQVPTAVKLHVLEGAVTYFPLSTGQIHYLLTPNPGCCISSLLVIYTPPPSFALKTWEVSEAKSRSPLTVKIPGQKVSSTHPNDITAPILLSFLSLSFFVWSQFINLQALVELACFVHHSLFWFIVWFYCPWLHNNM